MAQGILAYQAVISKLKDKASTLPESAPKHNVESFQSQYDSLISAAKVWYPLYNYKIQNCLLLDL